MDGRAGVALFRLPSMVAKRKPEPPPCLLGIQFILMGIFVLGFFIYAAVLSKLLPPSGIYVLDAMRNDWYYNLLVPLTIPIMMGAVYLHWLSMKLFKHA